MKKTYKEPNLNSPRERNMPKDYLSYPQKDPAGFFDKIKQQHPQLQKYTNKEIAGWIQEYNKQMATEVATSRKGLLLPEGLGAVVTGLCKPTSKTASYNIDYRTSGRIGIAVPYRNHHTNDYLAKISYTNNIPRCRFTNHQIWTFKPVRALSRAVSAMMKNEAAYNRYIVFTKEIPVSGLFNKTWNSKSIRRQVKKQEKEQEARLKAMAEYDEFSFD